MTDFSRSNFDFATRLSGFAGLGFTFLILVCGCRNTELDKSHNPSFFEDITEVSGLDFLHTAGVQGDYYFPEIMGGGAALFDADLDGDLDIYFTCGNTQTLFRRPISDAVGVQQSNRFFRQEEAGHFVDATDEASLTENGYSMGVAVGDVNNDGYPDLFVTNYGPDRLYLNLQNGRFRDVTESAGIDSDRWSMSACFIDYDRDGWLDLFVTNYVDYRLSQPCHSASGQLDYCNPAVFPKTADMLFRNCTADKIEATSELLSPNFQDVSLTSKIAEKAGAGLGAVGLDFSGDGWMDIYVANDGNPNRLWINQTDGTFRDEAVLQGVAYDSLGRPQASMGIAIGDLNQDARQDLVVTHLDGETHAVYLSSPSGSVDANVTTGLAEISHPFTGFGTAFVDVEHDGDLDLVIANGRVRRGKTSKKSSPLSPDPKGAGSVLAEYTQLNQLLINDGLGYFSESLASLEEIPAVSRALVCGDIDSDGDLDLLIANLAGRPQLLRNIAENKGHWLLVSTVDPAHGKRHEYGTVVVVYAEGKTWVATCNPNSSYLASHDPRLHFGLGAAALIDRIEVRWPDGTSESFPGLEADRAITLTRGNGRSSGQE